MAGLHPTLRKIATNLPRVARAQGFQARVTSGYRSRAAQTKLYNRWVQGLQPYPVAYPGTSDHEKGIAIDAIATDTAKLVALLTSAGLNWAGPSDPVHFTFGTLPSQAKAKSTKKSIFKKALGAASWVPGPVGIGATVLDFLF